MQLDYEDTSALMLSVRCGGDGEDSEDDDDECIVYSNLWMLMKNNYISSIALQL